MNCHKAFSCACADYVQSSLAVALGVNIFKMADLKWERIK